MPILLTSNGLHGEINTLFPTLLTKAPAQVKVAFVTTATYGEDDDISWLEKYRDQLRRHGITDIVDVDLRTVAGEQLVSVLKQADVVYMNGGNTYFLLYYVRQSGFDKLLKKFLDDGKLYVGVSAGSIIGGKTIETAIYALSDEYTADKNDVGVTDLTGLCFVPFLISPHFEESQRRYLTEVTLQASAPVVALSDLQAILVDEMGIRLVGQGEKVIFNTSETLPL